MDRLFETQKKVETKTEQKIPQSSGGTKRFSLKTPQEQTLQFEEKTFSLQENQPQAQQQNSSLIDAQTVDFQQNVTQSQSTQNFQSQNAQPSQGQQSLNMPEKTEQVSASTSYIQSFENKTVADILRDDAERKAAEMNVLEKQKEALGDGAIDLNMTIEAFQQKNATPHAGKPTPVQADVTGTQTEEISQGTQENLTIIEKPNYDFLQEPKRKIKLSKKECHKTKRLSSKAAAAVLAVTLAGSGVICACNALLIDQMSASYIQIDETYKMNLAKYLKDINNLDATKKSMEFLETYPDDVLDAGDIGEKSNWFDRLCNFLGGLFGG